MNLITFLAGLAIVTLGVSIAETHAALGITLAAFGGVPSGLGLAGLLREALK